MVYSESVDIMFVTETWLNSNAPVKKLYLMDTIYTDQTGRWDELEEEH